MKIICSGSSIFWNDRVQPRVRRVLFLLVLLGLGGGYRATAATFPPGPANEFTNTFAALRVNVTDSHMQALMTQGAYPKQYVGWDDVGATLTSPGISDFDTRIGISAVQVDVPVFGFPVGVDDLAHVPPLHQRTITGNPDPNYFFADPPGARELFTEIQALTLQVTFQCTNNDPRVPTIADLQAAGILPWTLVKGGMDNGLDRRSLGLVRSTTGNPAEDYGVAGAKSFFDVFVEVILPRIPNTASWDYFPMAGAVLTNDAALIVAATGLKSVPPGTVYMHEPPIDNLAGDPWPVNLRFKEDSPLIVAGQPYYRAGDIFGQVFLAGHGTFPCGAKNATSDFLDAVFGKVGQLAPGAVQGFIYPTAMYPWPSSTYDSAKGTNFNGTSVDAVGFTNPIATIFVRNLSIAGFGNTNPIALPPPNSSATFSDMQIAANLQISADTNTFYPATATGQVQVLIVNTNPPTSGNVTRYYAQILDLSLSGSYVGGSFIVRQSPTKASPGKHVVESLSGGDYRIGGYFDATLEYSINGGVSWRPATRPIRLVLANPPCGAATASLSGAFIAPSTIKITWANGSYRLQGTATLGGSDPWVDLPVTSPYVFNLPSPYHFFRLVCP